MNTANTPAVATIISGDSVTLCRLLRWITDSPKQEIELPAIVSGWERTTAKLPPNHRLLFTTQPDLFELTKRRVTFILLETRPFAKEETLNQVNEIRRQIAEASVLVVLMEQPHKEGYTDLTTSGEDLSEAQRLFQKNHVETLVLTERENMQTGRPEFAMSEFLDMLNWEEAWDLSWGKRCYDLLDALKFIADPIEFSETFRMELEDSIPEAGELNDYLGVCGDVSMAQIISYRSLARHRKETIWENYSAELERRIFPKDQRGGIYPIIKWFRDMMEYDFIPGWNAKQDAEQLVQILRVELQSDLRKERAASLRRQHQRERRISAFDEENYKRMISEKSGPDSHIQVDFPVAVRAFVNQHLPELIRARLNARVSILETACRRYQQAEGVQI